ncbi:MAG TPA: HIRAN domain-containing protein [Kofleriaceae bacterium]
MCSWWNPVDVRSSGEFRFWYEDDLTTAQQRGFRMLPEFPAHRRAEDPYVERYLFPLFAERIPAPTRRDAAAMLAAWGVEHLDDQFEVLARSGGLRATDRLELAEYRAADDDLSDPLEFRIAGRRHLVDVAPLAVGDAVSLQREPDNAADPAAVVVDRLGRRAGYVPRQYTRLLGGLLDGGVALRGNVIRELVLPEDVGRLVVQVTASRT